MECVPQGSMWVATRGEAGRDGPVRRADGGRGRRWPGQQRARGDARAGPTIGGPLHAEMYPSGLEMAPDGTVVIADTGNNRVAKYNADGTLVWSVGTHGAGINQFDNPRDVGVDASQQRLRRRHPQQPDREAVAHRCLARLDHRPEHRVLVPAGRLGQGQQGLRRRHRPPPGGRPRPGPGGRADRRRQRRLHQHTTTATPRPTAPATSTSRATRPTRS